MFFAGSSQAAFDPPLRDVIHKPAATARRAVGGRTAQTDALVIRQQEIYRH
jgi:hypothetical protein